MHKFIRAALALTFLLTAPHAFAAVEVTPMGVVFTHSDPQAGSVSVAGEFNNWNTTTHAMRKQGDVWRTTVKLPAGSHEYKFVVDGQWIADPDNPRTAGGYGNSVVEISSAGTQIVGTATSNVAFSPKIMLGGRMIGLYKSSENAGRGDQYELERPSMDIDLDWNIRVNEIAQIHLLTNINNENEATVTEFWRTNMRFDRGSITANTEYFDIKLFDNEAVGTWEDPMRVVWDDPLQIVGGIGIYDHAFGYRQQGAIATTEWRDLSLTLLYADDFENGGTTRGTLDSLQNEFDGFEFADPDRATISSNPFTTYDVTDDDNDKDVFAARARLPLNNFRFGGSFRLDRGYNPGTLTLLIDDEADLGDTLGTAVGFANTVEQWYAGGGDIQYSHPSKPYKFTAEFLHGRAEVVGRGGTEADAAVRTVNVYDEIEEDSVLVAGIEIISQQRPIPKESYELDRSNRIHLGGSYRISKWDMDLGIAWERETHEQNFLATGIPDTLENSLNTFSLAGDKSFKGLRGLTIGVQVDWYNFDYDTRTPWENQFWFDKRNFWLEQNEHEVSYHRMTLLGGEDVMVWKPGLAFSIYEPKAVDFEYRGRISGVQGRDPKLVETYFILTARPWKQVRLMSDTRLAKYNDPVLALFSSFASTFAEVAWEFGQGLEIALSYGVDPYVVDETINEYSNIGRDAFLFDRGANGDAARRNYPGLGDTIRDAEQALQDEERFQIEGIIHF